MGVGLTLIQGLTPVLAADNSCIKREEFEEEAAPKDSKIEALEPQVQTTARGFPGLPNNPADPDLEPPNPTAANNQNSANRPSK